MEKVLFLMILTVMTVSMEDMDTQNSTCFKTLRRIEIRKPYSKVVSFCCSGFLNVSGNCTKAPCLFGKYGENCTEDCPCALEKYERCDSNGTCLCRPGWNGKNCSKACDEGKYGEECKHSCSCRNNATCDHVTGICNCSSIKGKTGTLCDEDCPATFYGRNCSLACNCSDVQSPVCDSISGDCICESGKRGNTCTEDCTSYTFGANCVKNCTCVTENSLSCNSSTGVCYCKPGWRGDSCQTRCDLFHYGDGCAQNCSCNETEVCDNVNGSCSPAHICLATNTLNCLTSYNMTCQQVAENCNQSNTPEQSLIKDMQNICCNGEQTQIVCIAKHGCSCREQYAGPICNSTLVPSSGQKDTIEESSALESSIVSTVVPVVVSLLVILGIALTVVAVMWRKRTSKIPQNAHNPGYGKAEPYIIQDKPEYAATHRLGQDNLEMYDANIHDVNDYGYDVHNRVLNFNQNENYASTTNFGEEYDHLQRNSHREEGLDDAYSHQHFLESHDDYSNVRTQIVETNNEYATAKDSASKDDIYCNTRNNSSLRNSSSDI
nr:protein draper isoform X4 [Crassostrea gigas]